MNEPEDSLKTKTAEKPVPAATPAPEQDRGPAFTPRFDPARELLWESSPSRYIAKVSAITGKEVLRPIDPDDLLVHAHRDRSAVELVANFLASRLVDVTGNEETVRRSMRKVNRIGERLASALGSATGSEAVERQARRLIGVVDRDVYYQFREPNHLSEKEVKARVARLQREGRTLLTARGRNPRLSVLLTGATGFLGKEFLRQAADERRIAEVVCVIRPETIRDPRTREVVRVLAPSQRGAVLLKRLGIAGARARKFRFVDGDIEQPSLGISEEVLQVVRRTVTHVVHCAASVSFDDTYENSFRANVVGCRNALDFSTALQRTKGSKFIQHVAIETSYVHGRKKRSMAQESNLVFPRNFYNNFYELTKAMASLETDRYLVHEGLRVAQLLPSIVIGHSRTGNNYGDTKVVNAPINAFGRSKAATDAMKASGDPVAAGKAWMVLNFAAAFPGDPTAELNLVPVDRVVEGMIAVLFVPEAIGERIHLATDNRIRSLEIATIAREEIGINIHMADPTLFRNVTLPIVKAALEQLREPKLASALSKLGTIFGGYNEWGQPIHEIGNDVRVLGLPIRRPNTLFAFRMLCRHNKYVQAFGTIRDADEIARRELVWEQAMERLENASGRQAASMTTSEFRRALVSVLDARAFRLKA